MNPEDSCGEGRDHADRRKAPRIHRRMKPDSRIEAESIGVPQSFCSGFADRAADRVMRLFDERDQTVVTSEEPVLRGRSELKSFLDRYVKGATTYSWEWDRYDIATAGSVACLLAVGTETATTADRIEQHPYRMTMVLERRAGRWLLIQVHGHHPTDWPRSFLPGRTTSVGLRVISKPVSPYRHARGMFGLGWAVAPPRRPERERSSPGAGRSCGGAHTCDGGRWADNG